MRRLGSLVYFIFLSSIGLAQNLPNDFLPEQKVKDVTEITQTWLYTGFIYEENHYPAPNPNLQLTFEFTEKGLSKLRWKRSDENFFCERWAQYFLVDSILKQETIWLNPENDASCQKDPDMQMGRITINPIRKPDTQTFHLYLELNGKPFIFVLNQISNHNPSTKGDTK